MGHYPVTIATQKLFLQLFHGIGHAQERAEQPVNFLDLAACLLFVLREVFTGFHNWRFVVPKDKEEIGKHNIGFTGLMNKLSHLFCLVTEVFFQTHKAKSERNISLELSKTIFNCFVPFIFNVTE